MNSQLFAWPKLQPQPQAAPPPPLPNQEHAAWVLKSILFAKQKPHDAGKTVALLGRWGSGKSVTIERLRSLVSEGPDVNNRSEADFIVLVNAWQADPESLSREVLNAAYVSYSEAVRKHLCSTLFCRLLYCWRCRLYLWRFWFAVTTPAKTGCGKPSWWWRKFTCMKAMARTILFIDPPHEIDDFSEAEHLSYKTVAGIKLRDPFLQFVIILFLIFVCGAAILGTPEWFWTAFERPTDPSHAQGAAEPPLARDLPSPTRAAGMAQSPPAHAVSDAALPLGAADPAHAQGVAEPTLARNLPSPTHAIGTAQPPPAQAVSDAALPLGAADPPHAPCVANCTVAQGATEQMYARVIVGAASAFFIAIFGSTTLQRQASYTRKMWSFRVRMHTLMWYADEFRQRYDSVSRTGHHLMVIDDIDRNHHADVIDHFFDVVRSLQILQKETGSDYPVLHIIVPLDLIRLRKLTSSVDEPDIIEDMLEKVFDHIVVLPQLPDIVTKIAKGGETQSIMDYVRERIDLSFGKNGNHLHPFDRLALAYVVANWAGGTRRRVIKLLDQKLCASSSAN